MWYVCQKEKLGLTFWSVNQQSLKTLVCANFYGPIGGLAQHGRSYSVKVVLTFNTQYHNTSVGLKNAQTLSVPAKNKQKNPPNVPAHEERIRQIKDRSPYLDRREYTRLGVTVGGTMAVTEKGSAQKGSARRNTRYRRNIVKQWVRYLT